MAENDPAATETEPMYLLEQGKRFSESLLWQIQRNYFERQGIAAWRQGDVPHYITSNPYIAEAYARVVCAYWTDLLYGDPGKEQAALDLAQPVYIIELGSGPGRFAFHFLKQLSGMTSRSRLAALKFKYIMTDLSQRNLDFWAAHPALKPFVEAGVLDFACFDAAQPAPLRLFNAGELLAVEALPNPAVVIANYFFDCIPQDVFYIKDGQLQEGRVSLTAPQAQVDLADPELISKVTVVYEHLPVESEIYTQPAYNRILSDYCRTLGDTSILFPIASLECMRFFMDKTGGRLLLLTGDKGVHWAEDLITWDEPQMVIHGGCFSMTHNYHAIAQYIQNQGGQVLNTSRRHPSLDIGAFLLGAAGLDYAHTRLAFEQSIEVFGPDDFFKLLQNIHTLPAPNIDQIVAWMRLSRWDVNIMLNFFPQLMDLLPAVTETQKEELFWIIQRLQENYYDIGEGQRLAFHLGTLLCALRYYAEAIKLLEQSMAADGPDPRTLYNLSLSYFALRQDDAAYAYINQALEQNPESLPVKDLRVTIESHIRRKNMRDAAI